MNNWSWDGEVCTCGIFISIAEKDHFEEKTSSCRCGQNFSRHNWILHTKSGKCGDNPEIKKSIDRLIDRVSSLGDFKLKNDKFIIIQLKEKPDSKTLLPELKDLFGGATFTLNGDRLIVDLTQETRKQSYVAFRKQRDNKKGRENRSKGLKD